MSGPREKPALAIDIGGTKILVALVAGDKVIERHQLPTPREAGGDAWCAAIVGAARPWMGRYSVAGAAVTGAISDGGRWSALNPDILPIPTGFPLQSTLARHLDVPVLCANDAQAAAWGEYRYGAGGGRDMGFVTISTGVGGGIILGGRLLSGTHGLAGSIGQLPLPGSHGRDAAESACGGRWIAKAAAGRTDDARGVFVAADAGAAWANDIINQSVVGTADLIAALQWIADPEIIVVGGGIGLVPRYFAALEAHLAAGPSRAMLRPAQLGADAGIIGIADLAANVNRISS